MEQPSFDKATVEHQYDTLMKKVLAGEAKNLRAKLSKRRTTNSITLFHTAMVVVAL